LLWRPDWLQVQEPEAPAVDAKAVHHEGGTDHVGGSLHPSGLGASIAFLLGYLFQLLPFDLKTMRIDDFHFLIAMHEAVNFLPCFCGSLYLDRRRLHPAMRFSGSNVIL
jgi:hypothetical protein